MYKDMYRYTQTCALLHELRLAYAPKDVYWLTAYLLIMRRVVGMMIVRL